MGEYHLQTIPDGHAIMRFCPWCRDAFPESKRGSFFTDPRDDEVAELDKFLTTITDVDEMRGALGEPDNTIPSHPDNKPCKNSDRPMNEPYYTIPNRAAETLRRRGGGIEYSEQFPRGYIHLGETKVCDSDLNDLVYTPGPAGLDLAKTSITDVGAESVGQMHDLEHLSLYQTKITDRALESLGNLANLNSLELGSSPG